MHDVSSQIQVCISVQIRMQSYLELDKNLVIQYVSNNNDILYYIAHI